jgi:hypothetical protein
LEERQDQAIDRFPRRVEVVKKLERGAEIRHLVSFLWPPTAIELAIGIPRTQSSRKFYEFSKKVLGKSSNPTIFNVFMKRVVRFETETFHEFQLQLGRSGSLAMGIMGDYGGGDAI